MKIAVISDIHSNYYYFKKILKSIENCHVDEIYCLGDIVGYYDEPGLCIDEILHYKIKCIKGNHDKYLLGELKSEEEKYEIIGNQKQKAILTNNQIEFLLSLPDSIEITLCNNKFLFTHSSPGNSVGYIYNASEFKREQISKYDFLCTGHTHIPYINYHFGTCIINPGSIGQPRDYTQMPSFAIVDTNGPVLMLCKNKINNIGYIRQLKLKKYPVEVREILLRNKNG